MKPAIDWSTAVIESHYKTIRIIYHSGRRFKAYRYFIEPDGTKSPIWPIREYLIRTDHTHEEKMRIIKLNPRGCPEGHLPIGILYTKRKKL